VQGKQITLPRRHSTGAMDVVRSFADGAKGYVSEQVAAVKAFNKREALLQGVNLGEHVRGRHGLRHHAGNPSPRCPCSVCPCKRRGGIRHLYKLKHMDLWPPQA
jgi:hypothetical protein